MVLIAHLVVGAFLALLGASLLRRFLVHARLMQRLRVLAPTPVAQTTPGLAMAHGTLDGDPVLRSPYQGRPCVYWFFRVQAPDKKGRLRSIATGKQWTLAQVRDDTGTAQVQGPAALVASPRRFQETLTGLVKIPPDKADFFEHAGIDEKHLPRFDRLVIHEYTFEPGDEAYVTGTLGTHNGEKSFYRKRRSPLIVSADPDIGYLQGLRHELLLYAALTPMVLIGAAVLVLLAFA